MADDDIIEIFSKLSIKKNLGQFYTTKYKYVLQNLNIPDKYKNIIEPFAGNGDLLKFISKDKKVEYYDIDPKQDYIIKKDTLLDPPDYKNKFVITNPPYLARNKSDDKAIFDKYKQNDLYKCFIFILTNNNKCAGGILILPLNFWCSIRKNDIKLRKEFLKQYDIIHLNIFEESVFDDTSYSICSFQFEKKESTNVIINCTILPSCKNISFELNENNNYTFGGEIYNLKQDANIKISRLTKNNTKNENKTNILVKCIDDSLESKICFKVVKDDQLYIDNTEKSSARSYATLIIKPKIDTSKQQILCKNVNEYLEKKRIKYNSLFLTNYRESNSIARKRISFKLVFEIVNYHLHSI